MTSATNERNRTPGGTNRDYAIGLARAFGGAIIFSLPLLMTMEMWYLGFYLDRPRLLLFLLVNLAMLALLSRFAGFEPTPTARDDVMDAFAAYGVGVLSSAVVLLLFGVIGPGMPMSEIVGKVAVQSVPASFGAIVARKQMGGENERDQKEAERDAGYPGQLFLMAAGALFLAFNVAPTEEMILIAFKMSGGQMVALLFVSIVLLHAFVFTVGFGGQADSSEAGFRRSFVAYTLAGYGIALVISLYVLWTFGRTDGADLYQTATMTVVLGFPAAIGAAIARLVV